MRRWMLLGALLSDTACGNEDCDPSATEICNNQDDNCDGRVDEGLDVQVYYADGDSDGYGTSFSSVTACAMPDGYATASTDCNDTDPALNPGADEVCDGVDNDCDGAEDAEDGTLSGDVTGYLDEDGDGYGGEPGFAFCELPSGFITEGGDCDDFDAAVTGGWLWYTDSDGDGYGDPESALESCTAPGTDFITEAGDCDDSSDAIHPDAEETCNDGIDNNCDGTAGDCAPLSGELSVDQADVTITGTSSYFGRWLSGADLDGSGVNALVTADILADSATGEVYAFSGLGDPSSLEAIDATGLITSVSGNAWGYYTVAVDDLTGDGRSDVLTMFEGGTIVVFDNALDGEQLSNTALYAIEGLSDVFDLEAGVLAAGDFTGDGAADLLVGDPEYTDSYTYEGRAFMVKGPLTANLNLTDHITFHGGGNSNAQLGFQVMDGGDTSGDGGHEILLTARRDSSGGATYGGTVFLLEGTNITGDTDVTDAETVLLGSESSGYFGQDAGAGGDLNGDGYDDVIIGAYGSGTGGQVYVFNGPLDGAYSDSAADTIIYSDDSNAYLGWRVAMAGDLNDDGIDDIAFTELLSSHAVSSGGAVGIALGPLSASYSIETADAVIVPTYSIYLGHDIAGLGDVDGDGVDDLGVSAYNLSTVWVFFGGSGF